MSTHVLHPLAADYLERLRRAGRGLPRGRLQELVVEIDAHLSEAIGPDASDAEALTVLDRLGEPEAIVEAEQPHVVAIEVGRGTREWATIFLLLFGGFGFGLGWVAGLVLLWSSGAWTTRDKLIGTLVIPGGLATSVIVGLFAVTSSGRTCSAVPGSFAPEFCTGGVGSVSVALALFVVALFVVAPIATAVYLARQSRSPTFESSRR